MERRRDRSPHISLMSALRTMADPGWGDFSRQRGQTRVRDTARPGFSGGGGGR